MILIEHRLSFDESPKTKKQRTINVSKKNKTGTTTQIA